MLILIKENFQKMKAGANGVSKAVKEIKKQLAGFDEINMLTDQSDTGTSGGAGGVGTPSIDLSKIGKLPDWMTDPDTLEMVAAAIAGIAAALVLLKLGLDPLLSLGIGLMIGGLIYAIQGVIDYLKDPSWKNFGKIIQGIGVFIIGLGAAFLGLPAVITGVAVLILGTIIKYWDKISAFIQQGLDWLTNKSDWIHEMFGDTIGSIYDLFVNGLKLIFSIFDNTFKSLKSILDGVIQFIKGVFTGNWKQAWEGVKQVFRSIWDGISSITNGIISYLSNMVLGAVNTVGTLVYQAFRGIINKILDFIESFLNKPIDALNGVIGFANKYVPRSKFGLYRGLTFTKTKNRWYYKYAKQRNISWWRKCNSWRGRT